MSGINSKPYFNFRNIQYGTADQWFLAHSVIAAVFLSLAATVVVLSKH